MRKNISAGLNSKVRLIICTKNKFCLMLNIWGSLLVNAIGLFVHQMEHIQQVGLLNVSLKDQLNCDWLLIFWQLLMVQLYLIMWLPLRKGKKQTNHNLFLKPGHYNANNFSTGFNKWFLFKCFWYMWIAYKNVVFS